MNWIKSEVPKDRKAVRWHKSFKCPMSVCFSSQRSDYKMPWIEAGRPISWSEESFLPNVYVEIVNPMEIKSKAEKAKEGKDLLVNRRLVAMKYCEQKGWGMESLSLEKIFEIRKTEAWINGNISLLD